MSSIFKFYYFIKLLQIGKEKEEGRHLFTSAKFSDVYSLETIFLIGQSVGEAFPNS